MRPVLQPGAGNDCSAIVLSLIDAMVMGLGRCWDLAAIGPGNVPCDYLCRIFMFLSIAAARLHLGHDRHLRTYGLR
ncbi:protein DETOXIFICATION 46, chloroplastic-like [Musa acuminata AAA Group]|uniref:protein DETOXIFICATION 46, chloroplastic-like n=1 Tax=Musa acuminata AAA Group TaxID=214697 RepID=UPI0031D40DCE